jgi:hypothetical protein
VLDLKVHRHEPILSVWNKTGINVRPNKKKKCGVCFSITLPCEGNGDGRMCLVITYLKHKTGLKGRALNVRKQLCVSDEMSVNK